jgi:hypothetical protein
MNLRHSTVQGGMPSLGTRRRNADFPATAGAAGLACRAGEDHPAGLGSWDGVVVAHPGKPSRTRIAMARRRWGVSSLRRRDGAGDCGALPQPRGSFRPGGRDAAALREGQAVGLRQ